MKGKEIIRGIAASPGLVVGIIRVVDKDPARMVQLKQGEIMVAERTTPADEIHMAKVAAMITNAGGKTSHTAIIARERGVPAVVGTLTATKVLVDGQKVVVDGSEGAVYEYVEPAVPPAPPTPSPAPPTLSSWDKIAALAKARNISLDPAFVEKMKHRD